MVVPRRDLFSKRYAVTSVQTSRGCPMDCDFCSVTAFNGREYRLRPPEEVLDELEGIPEQGIFFVDDNLIGYGRASRQRAKDLFRGMTERKLNKKWICQASVNFGLDEELLLLANKSGCVMVLVGLESDDPEQLLYMNKKLNVRHEYSKILRNINKYGILVFGGFIFGVKNETERSMWRKARFICRKRIDVVQTTILTPLPGTRLFKAALEENRILSYGFPQRLGEIQYGRLYLRTRRNRGRRVRRNGPEMHEQDILKMDAVMEVPTNDPSYETCSFGNKRVCG